MRLPRSTGLGGTSPQRIHHQYLRLQQEKPSQAPWKLLSTRYESTPSPKSSLLSDQKERERVPTEVVWKTTSTFYSPGCQREMPTEVVWKTTSIFYFSGCQPELPTEVHKKVSLRFAQQKHKSITNISYQKFWLQERIVKMAKPYEDSMNNDFYILFFGLPAGNAHRGRMNDYFYNLFFGLSARNALRGTQEIYLVSIFGIYFSGRVYMFLHVKQDTCKTNQMFTFKQMYM